MEWAFVGFTLGYLLSVVNDTHNRFFYKWRLKHMVPYSGHPQEPTRIFNSSDWTGRDGND